MRYLWAIFLVSTMVGAAAPKAKKPFNPFEMPQKSCAKWACDVTLADKVVVTRGLDSIFEPARRGCCSWHSGVCGCATGRAVCCDGTLSPGCGCD